MQYFLNPPSDHIQTDVSASGGTDIEMVDMGGAVTPTVVQALKTMRSLLAL